MTLSELIDLFTALTVLAGLGFAVAQVRHFRLAREREIALEMLRSYQTRDFAAASHIILDLPHGLSPQEVEDRLGDKMDLIFVFLATLESLGVLVYRREVSLDVVDDYFSGLIDICWQKLGPYIRYVRQRENRETLGEWIEWLHDRMAERERNTQVVPAHIAHRDWRPHR